MSDPVPRRGEIWFADVLGDKRRPVLVLTRDPMGRYLRSVICAPVTSRIRGLTTEVTVDLDAGLAHTSVVNCDNTFLLGRSRLLRRLGKVRPEVMDEVCDALAEAVSCVR